MNISMGRNAASFTSSRWPLSRISVCRRAVGVAILSVLLGATAGEPPRIERGTDPDSERGWAAYSASDFASALVHYRKAAARNDALAQFNLAVMLVQGLGTAPRPREGIAWLRKAAEGGLPRAQYVLAAMHERGEHVAKSMTQATAWYREAAERGWRDAQVALATQYFLGRGAPEDHKEAAKWYELAAAQGDGGACFVIASMYEQGSGVPRDLERALFWYAQAAAHGDPVADIKAREVHQRLRAT